MNIEYMQSDDGLVHLINCDYEEGSLTAGILCALPGAKDTCRITDGIHVFVVELPAKILSPSDRTKAFNVNLDTLSYEQVQFSTGNEGS